MLNDYKYNQQVSFFNLSDNLQAYMALQIPAILLHILNTISYKILIFNLLLLI